MKRVSSYLREHRLLVFATCIILILLLSVSALIVSIKPSTVSHEGLKDYFEAYLSEYNRLVDENMGYLDTGSENLRLYWQQPYHVKGVISSTHGAVLLLDPSDEGTAEITSSSEPIEYYVWPMMARNTTGLPTIRILKAGGYYHLDSQVNATGALTYVDPGANIVYTGAGHVFTFSNGGAVIIFGSLIESNRMLLKGSNAIEDWSKLQARLDSLSKFLWDCRDMLNDTSLKDIETKYKLPLLLERISSRLGGDAYRDKPSLFTEDYEELKTVCTSNETLTKVLTDYYEMQGRTSPTLVERLLTFLHDFMLPIIIGIILLIFGVFFEVRISRTKKRVAGARIHNGAEGNCVQIPKSLTPYVR